jgi:CxxC motif-containing protein (DUF1111 family)
MKIFRSLAVISAAALLSFSAAVHVQAQRGGQNGGQGGSGGGGGQGVQDPGVRTSSNGVGQPLTTLSTEQAGFFTDGLGRFLQTDSVSGNAPNEPGVGLGPGFNSNSCGSCHAQPAPGGTSPSQTQYPFIGANPQMLAANDYNAANSIPYFITADGPVREARFPLVVNSNGSLTQTADGGVHDVFTITGRQDAQGCTMAQPNFEQMQQLNNIIFRIPTPVFGAGLIEAIPDSTIVSNMGANSQIKRMLGITGHPNYSGNDGTITRFGWKAQNKSLEVFAGEAYNVEMGVTNELFPNERNNPPGACLYNATPEDSTNFNLSGSAILSDIVEFANFMRLLAPPAQSSQGIPGNPSVQSIQNGQAQFLRAHCDMCHTPSMQTGSSAFTPGLSNQTAQLFSDLLVHHMGSGLADNVSQGSAAGDEFRTAPLWGVGQRIFFLHDGRATPANGGLLRAIQDHQGRGSEANQVISNFNQLSPQDQQDLLNYLRSL